jgi:hypothetical protein
MSYNGSGTFNINSTGQPVVAGTVITASAFNALTTDLATGLTTAITKDGQTTTTARITFAQGITSSLTTDSSSVSTGSIITAGGAGIAKNLYVGVNANVAGTLGVTGVATFSAAPIYSSLTASSAVATDASKGLVSVTNTGTGNNVLATSPTLVTPILGTPQSGTLTNATGLPLSTGVTGVLPEANGGTGTTTGYYGFKNRIINGAQVINQRGATVTTASTYVTDRWQVDNITTSGAVSFAQSSTAPAGFTNSLKITVTTADAAVAATDLVDFRDWIEGFNVADFGFGTASAATFTLSFWVNSSVTGTYGVSFRNSASDRVYVSTYTISAANTWEQKTITVAGDTTGTWLTDNGRGLGIAFCVMGGSNFQGTAGAWGATNNRTTNAQANLLATLNNTFYITGVQLEKGSTATSFDYRPYGTELALCQRYFSKLNNDGAGSSTPIASGIQSNTTAAVLCTTFPVTMRAEPTAVFSNLEATDFVGWAAAATQTAFNAGFNTAQIQASHAANGAQYRPVFLRIATDTSGQITFSAEL